MLFPLSVVQRQLTVRHWSLERPKLRARRGNSRPLLDRHTTFCMRNRWLPVMCDENGQPTSIPSRHKQKQPFSVSRIRFLTAGGVSAVQPQASIP